MDEVLVSKFTSLEKCIKRIRDEYQACAGNIETDILRQDAIVLNLERACEQCLDMGQRFIRNKKWPLAKEYRDIFAILFQEKIIAKELSEDLQKMVGFRNLAIHDYAKLEMEQLKYIIEHRVDQLLLFGRTMVSLQ
jgi:uncharacterized protein YutE (UPF0331/DUF86 family)